ncbi:TonB-dependent receptor [Vibrio sp. CAIM 722]|uniref:TonB-dependent receptor n=1 Tax=Vibrio eleionomae TaxID=2653505 RepID=A0A7X4LMT9_9VIBR|nr:TonB-dependent receptor [Vibrio eleionomae]MZI94829.1 TonB-dependent receptor [Vibrio eleionomae]
MNDQFTSPAFGKPSYLKWIIASVLGTAPLFYAPLAVSAENTNSVEAMDTITVTGEKTNKDLKHTTTAVTVIDSDQLANGQYKQINDIVTLAPNVVSEGFGNITIRGISGTGAATGQYAYLTGSRSRVATIVDGVTQRWTGYSYSPSGLWDAKSVEVLRGPQSTSQGTNAIGGALVQTTNDPTYEYEAAVRGGLENYENGNFKKNMAVMFNAPIIDNELAWRVAVDGSTGEGWLNYAQNDDELDTGPDVNDAKNLNVRSKLLWEPSAIPGLSAKLTYNYHKYKGEFLTWVNDSDDDYGSQTQTLASTQNGNTRIQDTSIHTIATDINYDFDNGISNLLHMDYQLDHITFYQYPLNKTQLDNKLYTFTLDDRVNFAVPGSAWSGMTGLYFQHEKNNFTVDNAMSSYTSFDSSAKNQVSAIYGEATYALTPVWNLIGGGRLEHNTTDRDMVYNPRGTSAHDIDQDDSDTIFLPKVGMTYDVTDSTTVGGNIRRGYNAGGAGATMSTGVYYQYSKETVWAYELTSKTQFGNRASLATNLFYNDYSDYQAQSNSIITNVDSSHTYGIELEGTYWATDNLMLRTGAGLMNSKIDNNNAGDGDELPYAPHTNVSVGFTQYIGENFSFGADAKYVGEYYSDLDNDSDYKAGDYMTADARLSYTWGDLTIDSYIKNLANADIILLKSSSPVRASVGQTRTYGLNLTYKM